MPESKIVILKDYELIVLSRVFTQIPFEYGMAGIVGKKYEAVKDYLRWNDLDVKYWTPVVVNMGMVWAAALADKPQNK